MSAARSERKALPIRLEGDMLLMTGIGEWKQVHVQVRFTFFRSPFQTRGPLSSRALATLTTHAWACVARVSLRSQ